MRKNKVISWLLLLCVFFSTFSTQITTVYAESNLDFVQDSDGLLLQEDSSSTTPSAFTTDLLLEDILLPEMTTGPAGYITLSIEKFTLGQGYYQEPIKVPFYEEDNGANILTRVLGEDNYKNTGSVDSGFYLSSIKDNDTSSVNVPQYILDKAGEIDEKQNAAWFGESDYTFMAGWMYAVNNEFLSIGCSDYTPEDGDVMRWQFTVYGYGADLGSSFMGDDAYIEPANKDDLTAKIAEINSDTNKESILSKEGIRINYDHAYAILQNMESSQESVDEALIQLDKSLSDTTPPVLTTNLANQSVSAPSLTFTASAMDLVDGDIVPVVTLGAQVVSGNGSSYSVTLTEGNNSIKISATDSVGNTVQKSFTVTYTVPVINSPKEQLTKNLSYILKNVPNPTLGTSGGEWSILSLVRGNHPVPEGYYDSYYNNVVNVVKQKDGVLDKNKYTEHSRLILGLTAIGQDVTNVGRYNQLEKLADYTKVIKQGINGPVFALIALDSNNYEIPIVNGVETQTTKDMLIEYILNKEVNKGKDNAGGWSLFGAADPDITAMAMQGLTPYYHTRSDVKEAVDRAISWLSNNQKAEGGYASWGTINCESIAQVVVALTGLGIDPHTDTRFVKNGKSTIDALISFAVADGGFMHVKPTGTKPGTVNDIATDQGTYALVAYDRLVNGQNALYDMTPEKGTVPEVPKDTTAPSITTDLKDRTVYTSNFSFIADAADETDGVIMPSVKISDKEIVKTAGSYRAILTEGNNAITITAIDAVGNKSEKICSVIYEVKEQNLTNEDRQTITIPTDDSDYRIPLTLADSNKEVTLEIASENDAKVMMSLTGTSTLPRIEVCKGNVSLLIEKGTQVIKGNTAPIELITSQNDTATAIRNLVSRALLETESLDAIDQVITMGGNQPVQFNEFVTLTFKGGKDKEVGYKEQDVFNRISKYLTEAEGKNSGKNEYAYISGNDLVVKTNHFTDYILYSITTTTPGSPGEGQGGGGGVTKKEYVYLSIDKLMINKGYVIPETEVELQSGDNVWSLLEREMDKRGISYDYAWTGKYGSVYVESIAGDGEFDHGSGSGWMYEVNGWYPNYGASQYTLSDGDSVKWRYTTNLGADLGEDITQWEDENSEKGQVLALDLNNRNPIVNISKDIQKDYILYIGTELRNTDNITINIPDVSYKAILNLEDVKLDIPKITATKGDLSAVIEKGTQLLAGSHKVELMSPAALDQKEIEELIKKGLEKEYTYDKLTQAFMIGNSSNNISLNKPITLTIKNGKNQRVGMIEENKFTSIPLYKTEKEAIEATKNNEKQIYSFISGEDLCIKSNHLTTYVAYTVKESQVVNRLITIDLDKFYTDASAISTWAYEAIKEATQKGYVVGKDGKFSPKNSITRAEFTKIITEILGLDTNINGTIQFKDVSSKQWFYPYINAAYKAGIVSGSGNQFNPNENITREQMAVMVVRALDLQTTEVQYPIKDSGEVSSWAKTALNTVMAHNLMTSYNNTFNPQAPATREMATVVGMRISTYKTGTQSEASLDLDKGQINKEVQPYILQTAEFMQKMITDPVVASVGGEWTVLSLARSGISVPESYYGKYYANVAKTLKEKDGKLHHVKYTEYDRVLLALASIGKDGTKVAGYDLTKPLADFNTVIKQGLNGPIWALIALDSKGYEMPLDNTVKVQSTRDNLIEYILSKEIEGGGWSLTSEKPADTDITAMALQALSRYQDNAKVKAAINRALAHFSKTQLKNGYFNSNWGGEVSSESVAQVIVALTALDINPKTDQRFIKDGKDTITALLSYYVKGGGFKHVLNGEVDAMATDQGMYALIAYDRYSNGQKNLYDMTDVKKTK